MAKIALYESFCLPQLNPSVEVIDEQELVWMGRFEPIQTRCVWRRNGESEMSWSVPCGVATGLKTIRLILREQ